MPESTQKNEMELLCDISRIGVSGLGVEDLG